MSVLKQLIEDDYGLEGRGKWFHSADHDSLVYNADEDYFFWNSKGIRGNALEYLVKIRQMNIRQAKDFLKNSIGAIKENFGESKDVVPYDKLVDTFWVNGFENRDYWYKRCLKDETIDRKNLGYYNEWFTIPMYEGGEFKDFQMRRDFPNKSMHYWYKSQKVYLYNEGIIPFVTDRLYITEGTVDAILLNQEGFPTVSPNGTNTWQDSWFPKFAKVKEIYYIADYDKAGFHGAKLVANSLGLYKVKIVMYDGMYEKYDTVNFFQDGGTKDSWKEWIENHSYYLFELENIYGKTKDIGKLRKDYSWAR